MVAHDALGAGDAIVPRLSIPNQFTRLLNGRRGTGISLENVRKSYSILLAKVEEPFGEPMNCNANLSTRSVAYRARSVQNDLGGLPNRSISIVVKLGRRFAYASDPRDLEREW